MSDARLYYHHDKPFRMWRGGELPRMEIAYETWGTLNKDKSNAVLIFTGLSPTAHATSSKQNPDPGWWEKVVGPGCPVNTDELFVICFNSLGSCFGSTGPASINPETGKRYALDFPLLSLEDIAAVGGLLLDHLKIEQLLCAIGPSMGGMSAMAFSMMQPHRVRHLVSISSAIRAIPFAIALRSLQREIICADHRWQHGQYDDDNLPAIGLSLARKLGMITYRSAHEWEQRFGRERVSEPVPNDYPFGAGFEVESYLTAHAAKFIGAYDPNCYLYLSRAMDYFDAAEEGDGLQDSLSLLQLESALVIGVNSDLLFPAHQQQEIAALLSARDIKVTFRILESIQGHDSFLVDLERFCPVIDEYMKQLG